jgi:hypothetical protein
MAIPRSTQANKVVAIERLRIVHPFDLPNAKWSDESERSGGSFAPTPVSRFVLMFSVLVSEFG